MGPLRRAGLGFAVAGAGVAARETAEAEKTLGGASREVARSMRAGVVDARKDIGASEWLRLGLHPGVALPRPGAGDCPTLPMLR